MVLKRQEMVIVLSIGRVLRPKKLGGHGVLDLPKFNMALCLTWEWFQWKDPHRPSENMNIMHNETKKSLFRACTSIHLGNGTKVSFWHDRWLRGHCPKNIAMNLYKLAWRKNVSLAKGLQDSK
jgi:hypothetical protein